MINFLVTRPKHEVTTNYLFYWASKVLDEAKNRNIKILDLKKDRANQQEFTGVIKKFSPEVVYLNGHGNDDVVTGHNNEPLVQAGKNESLLKNAIVYALSCRSAKELGSSCVACGTKAYIGYNDDFIFLYEQNNVTRPLNDKTAKLYLEPSNLVANSIIKGNTAGQAYNKSQRSFRENIRKLMTSESPQEDKSHIPWLLWDMTNQVCLGDANATISDLL